MAELETLHLELESLQYAKNEEELKQFLALFEIDKDISTKSKFFILKTIQKSLDERVNAEGEEIQKVTWFKETIAKRKSSAGNQDSQPSELDALKKETEALKEKQQTEMNTLLSKLAAVIRAISLHSSLRSYVETLKDLSLPKLRKILPGSPNVTSYNTGYFLPVVREYQYRQVVIQGV